MLLELSQMLVVRCDQILFVAEELPSFFFKLRQTGYHVG